jgi:hypothetical protein
MSDKDSACYGCAFYKESSDDGYPMCRRYPPHLLGIDTQDTAEYPRIVASGWCGEHKPKDTA